MIPIDQRFSMTQPQKRFPHLLPAELLIDGEMVTGQVTHWSASGIQLHSEESLDETVPHHIRFFLERNQFGEEEVNFTEESWEREGRVAWTSPYKEGSWIGIEFDTPLHLPFDEIADFLSDEDFCHIAIFAASDPGAQTSSFDSKFPTEFIPSIQLSFNSRQLCLWTLWGIIVLMEIWVLILLLRH